MRFSVSWPAHFWDEARNLVGDSGTEHLQQLANYLRVTTRSEGLPTLIQIQIYARVLVAPPMQTHANPLRVQVWVSRLDFMVAKLPSAGWERRVRFIHPRNPSNGGCMAREGSEF